MGNEQKGYRQQTVSSGDAPTLALSVIEGCLPRIHTKSGL